MLPAADRQRYARHLLLAEVGEAGQERLCAARVQLPADMDPRAATAARDYLQRAGVTVVDAAPIVRDASSPIAPAPSVNALAVDREAVRALAGSAPLEPAVAALLGALHAVETIKAELALGAPLQLTVALGPRAGASAESGS